MNRPSSRLPPDALADGLASFGRRLRGGTTSAKATVNACLERIATIDASLGAFWHVAGESALNAAEAVDRQLGAGIDLGPLMGVPVALKDIIEVRDMPITGGTRVDIRSLCIGDSGIAARLRDLGAIVLGKLATSEFAVGSAGVNHSRGTPRNPWDATTFRVPGGSSSGSGVATAAGLCGLAIGTDTGGSIRTPAAYCGVVGIKPTAHALPDEGVLPMAPSLDSVGFMARSAADAALAWSALTGQEMHTPPPHPIRLGMPRNLFDRLSNPVARSIDSALETLESSGARLVSLDLPELEECQGLYDTISGYELGLHRRAFVTEHAELLNPDVLLRIRKGQNITEADYCRALIRMQDLRSCAGTLFEGVDAWVGPVKRTIAPVAHGKYDPQADAELAAMCSGPTRAANLLDLCAASFPVPPVGTQLPVGLQLIAPHRQDASMLALLQELEGVLGCPAFPETQLASLIRGRS